MVKEKPSQSGKGFESLSGFRASKESLPKTTLQDPQIGDQDKPILTKESLGGSEPSQELKVVELQETEKEDFRIANRLITLINQQILKDFKNNPKAVRKYLLAINHGNTQKYYAIIRLVSASRSRDITYEVNRWLRSSREINEIDEICKTLLLRGYRSQALSWIRSLGVEEMKYGTVPGNFKPTDKEKRNFRLEQARVFAEKANTTIEDLAVENKLQFLLNE